ncbi:MAG: hypothetical protein HY913_24085 [Desulfomonile tiedjei]|nr:hypothetical protein [Desulfomonile tiedjei]
MSSSLGDLLALVETDVPERLISANMFSALMSICRLLPMEISSMIGFEGRLAEKSGEVDLALRVPVPRGLEILAGNVRSCRLPASLFGDVSWERMRSLALDWQSWPKELREAVVAVWLGFDADQFSGPVWSPGLFYIRVGKSDSSREYCGQIARAAHAIVKNHPLPREFAVALDTCLKRLPDHALVRYVGMGISRPTEAIRILLADLTSGDMLDYLGSIGWPGNLRELESFFLDVAPFVHQFTLGIDILDSVCPKLAIEWYIGGEERSAVDRSWPDFLDFITGKGWCLQGKSEGLLQWPGQKLFQAGNDPWPWVVERFLNHSKVNYDPVSGVEAKGYFGLLWRRASEVVTSIKAS